MKKGFEKHEDFIKEVFSGRKQIASGAIWIAKGDIRNDDYLIECKSTEKDYFNLTAQVLDKIENEAVKDSLREPLLAIRVKQGDFICYKSYSGKKKDAKVRKIDKSIFDSVLYLDKEVNVLGDWILTTLDRYLEEE